MGVDVSILIGHRLSIPEILRLPSIIAGWTDVKEAALTYIDEFTRTKREDQPPRWDLQGWELTEADVLECWAYWEAQGDEVPLGNVFTIDIEAWFGWLKVNRHTLHIIPYQHKWANMSDPHTRSYIMAFSRSIAQHLAQKKVLYCVDSAFPPSHLEDFAYAGWEIDAIEDYGNAHFGKPAADWEDNTAEFYWVDRDW